MTIRTRGRAALLTLPLLLAACGDNPMRTFGLTRDAPDEFQVTTRAPLSMPPEYGLRPPQPGARRPQEPTPREAAEAALNPQAVLQPQPGPRGAAAPAPGTRGESALLAAAGPAAPTDIRRQVTTEQTALNAVDTSFADKLIFWRPAPEPGTVVDPTREAARIRENSALGQQATTGDTPIIQRRRPGLLEGLF